MELIKDNEKVTKYPQENQNADKNLVGIRDALKNMGISNNQIGYNEKNGMVTIGGKDFMKPTYLDDEAGKSYASNADIQKSVTEFYKDSNNPVVRVSDAYAASAGAYGLSADALSYGNGTVSIGGKPLDIMYIDDEGKSWARENDVAYLTENYAKSLGVQSPTVLAKAYEDKYLSEAYDKLSALENRKEFSYNPDEDPAFIAYRNKYIEEGNRASRNALADYSALTGGYTNSSAVTAGALANQYYAGQIANAIPELAQMAYQRYRDSYQDEIDVIDKILNMYEKGYSNAESANKIAINNANYSANSSVLRDDNAYDRAVEEYKRYLDSVKFEQDYNTQERENYWNELLYPLEIQGKELDNDKKQTYNNYYEQLLEKELQGMELDNQKTSADIQKVYRSMG